MRQLLATFFLFALAGQGATEREVAEWVLRWEGSVLLEGSGKPLHDVSQLPRSDFHISGIDLTAAVMHPVELRRLEGPHPFTRVVSPRAYLESRRGQGRQNRCF